MLGGIPAKYKIDNNKRTVISKNVKFNKDVGLQINQVIKIFNDNSKAVKLNNDLFLNIENCLSELKHKALEFEDK